MGGNWSRPWMVIVLVVALLGGWAYYSTRLDNAERELDGMRRVVEASVEQQIVDEYQLSLDDERQVFEACIASADVTHYSPANWFRDMSKQLVDVKRPSIPQETLDKVLPACQEYERRSGN